ncbi:MAG: OmpA family protein [Azonexus sp.]
MRSLKIVQFFLIMSLFACQAPVRPVDQPAYFKDPKEALAHIAKSLGRQITFVGSPSIKSVPVDEFFNESSAEVAVSGKVFQQQLTTMLGQEAKDINFSVLSKKNIATAQWIVLSSYSPIKDKVAEQPGSWIRLKTVVADVVTGKQLAASESYLQSSQFQGDPTKFFKESPMFLTDKRHKDRIEVMNGKAQPLKEKLTVQASFADAVALYDEGKFVEAEEGFREVLKLTPEHQGALSGIYQSLWQQGKKIPAESAFGKFLAVGFDEGNISIKILFKVNGTDFVDAGDLPLQYKLWTKSIGQTMVAKSKCLDVTGHASKSGSSEYNDRLSLQRATKVVATIQNFSPVTAGKLKANGKGFQETIVGTGSNDATDAIDRRVEFIVKTCN